MLGTDTNDTRVETRDQRYRKHTILSTEASVESMNADLFHTRLTCAMVENSLNLWIRGALQYARLLQLVLIVQQSIHELLHLEDIVVLLQTQHIVTRVQLFSFCHLYNSDFAVEFLYRLVEALHHILKLVGLLVNFGCFWQV